MGMDRNQHSVYLLHYHLVMCVKYRRPVINETISNALKAHFIRIGTNYGIQLEEWNHDQDHVHVLFRAKPNTEAAKFINAFKAASSRLIKTEYPEIRKYLWRSAFWSKSYCLLTTGGAPLAVIRRYIESQGERNGYGIKRV
ncbi:IS200/IS605 family transposase [Schleiferilactobacillus perolens]|uniref:IS200/IS605 family transposase n=1 Tax=Schleiferilactobacillus perolens TaxID=100468 RepID=UPI0023556807|nr:IS200/IS605 family transposase [Schleiferilactobacillus perolens]MCI2172179.1 IS200/IS605 family transposase [Schleiferilactobacillus perolens]